MRTFVLAFLLSIAAQAEEQQPCHYEGTNVVCTKEAFTTISNRYLEKDTALKVCNADLKGERDENTRLRDALAACPAPVECPQRNATLQHVGFALGIIGTAAAVMAPFFPQIGPVNQGLLIASGAITTGVGYVLTF